MNDAPKQLFNQEAEEALIGAALINPTIIRYQDLEPQEFFIQRHAWVWQAMTDLDKRGVEPDLVTLSEELGKRKQLGEVGGLSFLTGLISNSAGFGADNHARIIREYASRRNILKVATDLEKAAYDAKDISTATMQAIDSLAVGTRADDGAVHIGKVISEVYAVAEERSKNPKDVWGIPTGFFDFDRNTGGLHPGEVVYIAGEPGIGKSKLAIQMGINMGAAGYPGAIFSLEMGRKQLMTRSLSALAEVPTRNIKTGKMDADEWTRFNKATEAAMNYPVYISDKSGITTGQMRSEIARLQAQHGIQWVVIDYLLLLGDSDGAGENELSAKISQRVKRMAVNLDIAIISVNSVTKEGMGNEGQILQKNVRGASTVIHDADLICFLTEHKPEKFDYKKDNLRTLTSVKGRELEQRFFIHLVAFDQWPSFGNYKEG